MFPRCRDKINALTQTLNAMNGSEPCHTAISGRRAKAEMAAPDEYRQIPATTNQVSRSSPPIAGATPVTAPNAVATPLPPLKARKTG